MSINVIGILDCGDLKEKFVVVKRRNNKVIMVKILLDRMYLNVTNHCAK